MDKPKWIVRAEFRDENQPTINIECVAADTARYEVQTCARRFAGLRSITILEPNGDKVVSNGAGLYMYTVPASALKREKP
jgi:hypothetical protein